MKTQETQLMKIFKNMRLPLIWEKLNEILGDPHFDFGFGGQFLATYFNDRYPTTFRILIPKC